MGNKIESEEKKIFDSKTNSPQKSKRKFNSSSKRNIINNDNIKNSSSTGVTLKTSICESNRTDAYANLIVKGSKAHKVTFVDTHINRVKKKNLVEEIKVESYKKYNVDVSRKKSGICFKNCKCLIF